MISQCKHCQQPITEELRAARSLKRGNNIRAALARIKAEGGQVGRSRACDYDLIKSERAKGLKLREIALKLKVSFGQVQRALKYGN